MRRTPFPTLDGKPPLVIGHRGLPGLMPEETEASYEMAADLGTDAFEEDLHLTKDCVLVARQQPPAERQHQCDGGREDQSGGCGPQADRAGRDGPRSPGRRRPPPDPPNI